MSEWVLEVSEVNEYVRQLLQNEPALRKVRLRGEISNFKRHSSGHWYFTLKDERCRIAAVMFRQNAMRMSIRPMDGMSVIVSGQVGLYSEGGSYQITCDSMRPDGIGTLYQQFEALKNRLAAEGLFDEEHKRRLPYRPKKIAVVTSETGAVLHDICMQDLHVTMCLDRAGIVGDDGFTHHGVFDYAYLRSMPRMTIMAPKDENELRQMLNTALQFNGPIAIRYPRGSGIGVDCEDELKELPIGKGELLREGTDVCLLAIGSMVQTALRTADALAANGIQAGVINLRFAKPLDEELIVQAAEKYGKLVTLEEGALAGGVGSAVLELLNKAGLMQKVQVLNLGLPDEFVPHGDKKYLFRDLGLDTESIKEKITALVKGAGEAK